MKLSVIIVNYNVEHFLEQCLISVKSSMKNIDGEVFVVDNNSIDGSVKMVKEKFPEVILIANKENVGFSKANNQAIKKARGEYILLLNPDTVVEEDTFAKVVDFMDKTPDAGALGVKMVDGAGNFLPESKRGLPTPEAAFYKMFGISKLFPKSKRFSKYHLGYLDENEIHEVEVLAGAFMLIRKKVLDVTGLLDESFFMYGEDIDISYRIIKAGYKNYYFPKTRIIHYKGESTKKSSVNYVIVFYKAMVIFAKKHFTQKNAKLMANLINIAIYFRAFLAILSRFFSATILSFLDGVALFGGMILIKTIWEHYKYSELNYYPDTYVKYFIPIYVIIWLFAVYINGGYDKPVKIKKSVTGVIAGTVIILVIYSLLPENLRFSRATILLGTVWGITVLPLLRLLLYWSGVSWIQIGGKAKKRLLVIGDEKETKRVISILNESYVKPDFIGKVSPNDKGEVKDDFLGNLTQVRDIITIYNINEVIFCSKNINHQNIIDKMAEWQETKVDYKIAPEDSLSIIGSNSINTQGDLYTINISAVSKPENRRTKRIFDFFMALLSLIFYPVLIFFVKKPLGLLKNIFLIIAGKKSWIGYYPVNDPKIHLPKIKPGILSPLITLKNENPAKDIIVKANMLYARDYTVWKDFNLFFTGIKHLGD